MTNVPVLYRALNCEAAVKCHLMGKLWFRSLKYFRGIEGPGRDPSEGVGSYRVQGVEHRDVSDESPIFPAFILCFSELKLAKFGKFFLEVRHPNDLAERVKSQFPDRTEVKWHRVQYGKREVLDSVPSTAEHWDRKHYTKPACFAEEQEWRLVVFLPPPLRLLNDTLKLHVGNLQGILRLGLDP